MELAARDTRGDTGGEASDGNEEVLHTRLHG
jgi:hypothetical protein